MHGQASTALEGKNKVCPMRDPIDALRLRTTRLMVLRAGLVVATAPPATATLNLPGRPGQVSFQTPGR